jgi:hypothetical protein
VGSLTIVYGAPPTDDASQLPTAPEARARARLLHETIHATLQVVHHEYYREDESLKLPAATMQQVFREVKERQQVQLRWLAVNAQAMNADHKPRDAFEKEAAEVLSSGKREHEQIANGVYRLASTITLTSDCLKCHAPNRTSNKDKAAALVITMPLRQP